VRAFSDELEAAGNPAARRAAMERWVRRQLARGGNADLPLVAAAGLLATEPGQTVASLADWLGWDTRRLHREFVAGCGYGPKTLQRILRVQRALRLAHAAATAPRLADVAAVAGYADQAHMTRDFRALTGFTPVAFLAAVDPELGRWNDWCRPARV
jgi:transcriptional regulator GlxA family with amidase domain